jgi:prepilin-type N-terminal cleavage/methylation domain-containing protein
MNRQQGFSLIELIMVITLLSLAAVVILEQFTQVSRSVIFNESIQTATQLAQEGAETVLAQRRNQGFAAVAVGPPATESPVAGYATFTRTTTVNQPPTGTGCPPGADPLVDCKEIQISVSEAGALRAEINFLLVDY